MLHAIVDARSLIALLIAACVGTWGVLTHPVDIENPFLGLIQLQRPTAFAVLSYGYTTLWFTTPFLALSLVTSLLTIIASRRPRTKRTPGAAALSAGGD